MFVSHLLNCYKLLVSTVFNNLKLLQIIGNTKHILPSFVYTKKRYAANPYWIFSIHLGNYVFSSYDRFSNNNWLGHILYNWQTSMKGEKKANRSRRIGGHRGVGGHRGAGRRRETNGHRRAGGCRGGCSYLIQILILVQIVEYFMI